jgi:hypothetical protein
VDSCRRFRADSRRPGPGHRRERRRTPQRTVRLTNLDTGVELTFTTNEQGFYIAPQLNVGRYKIDVSAAGFAAQTVAEFRLEVNQTARFNFELKPGTVVETINVSASAVLLNTDTTEVGQVIDTKRITEMPLNGRNYLELAQFTTGVLPGGNSGAGSRARDEGAFPPSACRSPRTTYSWTETTTARGPRVDRWA